MFSGTRLTPKAAKQLLPQFLKLASFRGIVKVTTTQNFGFLDSKLNGSQVLRNVQAESHAVALNIYIADTITVVDSILGGWLSSISISTGGTQVSVSNTIFKNSTLPTKQSSFDMLVEGCTFEHCGYNCLYRSY